MRSLPFLPRTTDEDADAGDRSLMVLLVLSAGSGFGDAKSTIVCTLVDDVASLRRCSSEQVMIFFLFFFVTVFRLAVVVSSINIDVDELNVMAPS
jgi:uncharacterized membrane protein